MGIPLIPELTLRRTVLIIAILNISYFLVEFLGALHLGSASLLADSADFLEDASVNLLILLAMGWSAKRRARIGMVMAGILLLPALAFFWTVWQKAIDPVPPAGLGIMVVGLGALAVNLTCAFLIARHRNDRGSLTKAAFLSARNDAAANVGIIGAGLLTMLYPSIWPDLIIGLAIAVMNLDAATVVWRAARTEIRDIGPEG